MTETSLEQVIEERQFAGILQTNAEVFFRLGNTLRGYADQDWTKKHYFQLIDEADALESFLDDYGARNNRTYYFFRELVASLRGFAQAGYHVTHFWSRFDSYGLDDARLGDGEAGELKASLDGVRVFIHQVVVDLLGASFEEATRLGLEITPATFPEENFLPIHARQRLPRNVDEDELVDERHKIAEVVSKYIRAADRLRDAQIRRIADSEERRVFLARVCTEEKARVFESTVHNLQSAYDTYIKNTALESRDAELVRLRGHVSGALHLLVTTTHLTHFYERHESDVRREPATDRLEGLVDRAAVQDLILNRLLYWADRIVQNGRALAESLLPEYTNAQELTVELEGDLVLHARPAALIVGIVNHHGTPVEMEVAGQRCNAGSILELLVTVGSHPDERRFSFSGDAKSLRDIDLLFQHGLGENGIDKLPSELSYLRSK